MARSKLLKETHVAGDAIDLVARYDGSVLAIVTFHEGSTEKSIKITLALDDLACVAREIRQVLRRRRDELVNTIAVVEEKV